MEEIVNKNNELVLFTDVCSIIDQTRNRIATYVNTEVCLTNWHVGKRIKEDVLYNQRAEYGKQILKNLSKKLTAHYGGGWGYEKLKHCVRSAYLFSEDEIRYAARTQLTWTHLRHPMLKTKHFLVFNSNLTLLVCLSRFCLFSLHHKHNQTPAGSSPW